MGFNEFISLVFTFYILVHTQICLYQVRSPVGLCHFSHFCFLLVKIQYLYIYKLCFVLQLSQTCLKNFHVREIFLYYMYKLLLPVLETYIHCGHIFLHDFSCSHSSLLFLFSSYCYQCIDVSGKQCCIYIQTAMINLYKLYQGFFFVYQNCFLDQDCSCSCEFLIGCALSLVKLALIWS